jgi:hypothetical protein
LHGNGVDEIAVHKAGGHGTAGAKPGIETFPGGPARRSSCQDPRFLPGYRDLGAGETRIEDSLAERRESKLHDYALISIDSPNRRNLADWMVERAGFEPAVPSE